MATQTGEHLFRSILARATIPSTTRFHYRSQSLLKVEVGDEELVHTEGVGVIWQMDTRLDMARVAPSSFRTSRLPQLLPFHLPIHSVIYPGNLWRRR